MIPDLYYGDIPNISYFDKEAPDKTATQEVDYLVDIFSTNAGQDGRLSSQTRPARTYRRLLPSGRFTGR